MNRNTVIVDGTKAGAPTPCNRTRPSRTSGWPAPSGQAEGRNGIVVWKANGGQHREPDRLQLPRAGPVDAATRSGGTAGPAPA